MKEKKAIRLLLWSIGGSGTHYNGPAISSFRLYRHARRRGLAVSLAHAYPEQPLYPAVFEDQFFLRHGFISAVSPVGRFLPVAVRGAVNTLLFSRVARSWMKRYAQRFDVFHGLSGYTPTLALADAAVAQGLPAVVTPVIYSELLAGNPVKEVLGYLRHRVAILKRVQGVVAISSDIERRLLQLGIPEGNIVRIPMGGVDVADILRPRPGHHREKEEDQKTYIRKTTLGASAPSRLTSTKVSQILRYKTGSAVPFILMTDKPCSGNLLGWPLYLVVHHRPGPRVRWPP